MIRRLINYLFRKKDLAKRLRDNGAYIGNNFMTYGNVMIDMNWPFLLHIGDDVEITNNEVLESSRYGLWLPLLYAFHLWDAERQLRRHDIRLERHADTADLGKQQHPGVLSGEADVPCGRGC